MLVVVFRSRIRGDADFRELEALSRRMGELARRMPGFISYKDFAADDGEFLTLVEFSDEERLLAWRNHPEHVLAQQRGRGEFMSEYRIQVCAPLRDYRFPL